jgi:hypothetical protein
LAYGQRNRRNSSWRADGRKPFVALFKSLPPRQNRPIPRWLNPTITYCSYAHNKLSSKYTSITVTGPSSYVIKFRTATSDAFVYHHSTLLCSIIIYCTRIHICIYKCCVWPAAIGQRRGIYIIYIYTYIICPYTINTPTATVE